ncbi:hypothetical protein FHX46_004520 [Amycolatopsis viridis]|uniref:Uncharacterized protein n=1 Tax=Amycolatopsis viridis TaxID=185678 RepID=A0ABX0SZG4_9PSEU|nr:hypothetical protein [Amycolatopsis viridis]
MAAAVAGGPVAARRDRPHGQPAASTGLPNCAEYSP